ncbi:copper homeostasis protein [Paenibacillus sp. UNCCL117]|uniref:copper homeostasis protein CutC n=1 Tax=unclassified Paenibacillus TaxID=185978 RepID=UPI0008855183|nr:MULTISPECIES: copper homeostasis protein CutC [unclassified Paenibacillus]SDC28705.1 copper homeostasis protein [Paenibacillus sp. cl123]SFW20624.1 copper homeostasis protein [Paenibacillus sp. UNCCL117]
MILEVIATCMDDALKAEEHGANRLELITAITEGGLTPGIGLVQQVVRSVRIPVHVMVRPHSRSFVYDRHDVETMKAEIQAIAATGAAGIVIGALTLEGRIDEAALEALLPWAKGLQVTFHRAFDELEDQLDGLNTLLRYPQITRVLTSGGLKPAPEAAPEIRKLVEAARGSSLRILAGSGLTPEGIEDFIEQTGVTEVHFGSAVRQGRSGLAPIDPAQLRALSARLLPIG